MTSGKRRERGTFERPKGSGIWWVRYADGHGRLHREKVGPKALARKVYEKRKTEIREGRFFPQEIRCNDPLLADASTTISSARVWCSVISAITCGLGGTGMKHSGAGRLARLPPPISRAT